MTIVRKESENQDPNYVPVPRRTVYRRIWRFLMRCFTFFFIEPVVRGRKNFPTPGEGPVIIVANHNAFLEVVMIIAYAPYPLEFLTTGDIPLEPRFAFWANLYGFIPVKRGSMDRQAMSRALSVLEQGGTIALFPQGGIWDISNTQAHTGVAWLSQKSQAKIVPIGFGGTAGSFAKAAKLQRPRIEMHVGQPIDPTPEKVPGTPRKQVLEESTSEVMQAVFDLIPAWEKEQWHQLDEEIFELNLELLSRFGHSANGSTPDVDHSAAVSKFFHRPVLLDAMRRNLELPVGALERLATERDPQAFASALDAVLEYVHQENPYFLTYRFGNEEGRQMQDGLATLRDAAQWAAANNYQMNIQPIRRYRMQGEEDFTVQQYPPNVQEL